MFISRESCSIISFESYLCLRLSLIENKCSSRFTFELLRALELKRGQANKNDYDDDDDEKC